MYEMHVFVFHPDLVIFVLGLVSINSVVCGNSTRYLNDECLKPLDYSIYPRCIIHTFKNPKISCEDGMSDEMTIIENLEPGTNGGFVFECSGPNPINMTFDGYMPVRHAIVVPFWRNETHPEYVIKFGYLPPVDAKIVGKFSFFDIGNKSLEKSIYVYFKEAETRKSQSPFIFSKPKAYQLSPTKFLLPCRPYDKNITVVLQLVKQHNSVINVTERSWVSFDPQTGFTIDTYNSNEAWGVYRCYAVVNGRFGHPVTVDLEKTDISGTSSSNPTDDSKKLWLLHWEISQTNINCNIEVLGISDYQTNSRIPKLINIKARNSLEARLMMDCKNNDTNNKCDLSVKQFGQLHSCYHTPDGDRRSCSSLSKYFDSGLLVCSLDDLEIQLEYFKGLDDLYYPYSSMLNGSISDKAITVELMAKKNDEVLYTGKNYNFKCTVVIYGLSLPILWYTQQNDDEFQLYETERSRQELSEDTYILTQEQMFTISSTLNAIMCSVRLWDSKKMISAKYVISKQKRNPSPPTFDKPYEERTFFVGEEDKSLQCQANGSPEPELNWLKNGQKISDKDVSGAKTEGISSSLFFTVVDKIHAGNYTCTAENFLQTSGKTYILKVEDRPNYPVIIGSSVFSIVLLLGVLITVGIMYYRIKLMTIITKSERDEFLYGNPSANINNENSFADAPYDNDYEISPKNMKISQADLLGAGQYGIVYKGKVGDEEVAIKTTKKGCDKAYVTALLSELKLMIHIGQHRHIVSLVGASTTGLWKGEVYLALKLYTAGNLQNHLRKCQHFISIDQEGKIYDSHSDYGNLDKPRIITTKDLWKWSYQIANGMAYLTQKNVVHGDLATRNILLCEEFNVKISDFGLSRKLYAYGIYQKKSQEPLPWRWMSIEALKVMKFSNKSDVWSYGITLWEIFSLGLIPYPGVNWNVDFVEHLSSGLRLSKPKHAWDNMYELMIACWHEVPEKRKSFPEINEFLYRQLTDIPTDPYSGATYI